MTWNQNEWNTQQNTANVNDDGALGWDDTVEQESEFILLPPGDYDFTVTEVVRGRFEGSDKMSPCPKAEINMTVNYNGNKVVVFENLFLHKKSEWKLSEFFLSIGLKKKGEPLRMDWSKVMGARGKFQIFTHEWNGRQYNRIKKFIPFGE